MQLKDNKTISAHRAFVYAAGAPGLGELYAGSRIRGIITASLFVIFGIWFTQTMVTIVGGIVGRVFDSFSGISPSAPPDLPFYSPGISFLGIYLIWLWAMISAVDVAIEHRRKNAEPPQASVAWSVALSWFCPGSGQIYTGSRQFGYFVFAGYIMGILLIIPAYIQLFLSISELANSGKLSPNNPYAVINMVHGLIVKVDYSFGKLLQAFVRYLAVASTIAALRQGPLENDARWSWPSIGYGTALFGIGWLCPGAAQLLQKRFKIGWCILAGYGGIKVLIGLLLGHNLITVQKADILAWIAFFVQWGAMIEAPIWMMKAKWQK